MRRISGLVKILAQTAIGAVATLSSCAFPTGQNSGMLIYSPEKKITLNLEINSSPNNVEIYYTPTTKNEGGKKHDEISQDKYEFLGRTPLSKTLTFTKPIGGLESLSSKTVIWNPQGYFIVGKKEGFNETSVWFGTATYTTALGEQFYDPKVKHDFFKKNPHVYHEIINFKADIQLKKK